MNSETIICHLCNQETPRRGAVQKYCLECSVIKDNERKGQKKGRSAGEKALEERTRLQGRGENIADLCKRGICWPNDTDDDLVRLIRISMPFSWDFSKNRIYTLGARRGHVFLRQEMRRVRADLVHRLKTAIGSERFFEGKVWLDILVQKPDNRGDAVNVVDAVCDAVKVAIGVDDRYFSIRKLDWEIVKKNPMIYVGVGQSITEDHFCCSYCGRLQPVRERSAHKRTCLDCRHNRTVWGKAKQRDLGI